MADKRNYAVGKGKPPKHSQFKHGNCANPKGRGATKNLKTDLREELSENITLHENGERKVISKQRGMIKAAMAKALQGDMRAMAVLTTLTVKLLEAELADEAKTLSPGDVAILEEYIKRRLEAEKKRGESHDAPPRGFAPANPLHANWEPAIIMVIKPPTYEAFIELVRTDRLAFIEKSFQELHHGAKFHRALYQNAIDWELKRCEQGAGQNLIVFNLPPRHLKSEMISVIQSAWILAHEPGAHIISLSYGSDLVTKLSNQVRTIMNSQWYKDAFPNTRISPKKNTETDFETTAGGRRYATTVNAELTGHGAKYILIDDPHNVSQLPSAASLTSDLNWFKQGVWSRFEGHADGAFIVIMQRYHQQDLTAYLTQEFGFRQLKLEAIAKEDSNVQIGPSEFWERKKGDVLNPDWMSLEALQKTKQIMGDAAFEAQYQQDTTFGMGCLYRPDYFPHYKHILPRHNYEFVIAAFDTASTLAEESSFSACVICGVVGNEILIIRVWRDKVEFPRLLNAAHNIIDAYAPSHIIIENNSLGTALLHNLASEHKTGLFDYRAQSNKLSVAESFLDIVTAGRVHLPVHKPWLKAFEDELFGFPGGPFDDQVDAMNLVLRVIRRKPSTLTKIKYAKEPSQKAYPGIKLPMKKPDFW